MINQKQALAASPSLSNASSIKTKASTPFEYSMLQDGFCIPKALCDSVKFEVESILPAMIPNVNYTLEELCGEDYWNQLNVGARKLAGRYIADLVSMNGLPLISAKHAHEYPKKYKLK